MNLFFHPEGDDWSLRSYVAFGPMATMEETMATIEARTASHKGRYFLLSPGFKPFWQTDKSGLDCTVCVDNETYATPAGYVYTGREKRPCVPYRPCLLPQGDEKLVYWVGMSLEFLTKETHAIWREKSHDW